ncbi:conserved hypothetical protein [Roseibium sp. TrichSKD4]|uniref:hypothetical protein n=1 Tax=Roseibium sp. TrichSKD4 TaxID=744980 RepID=UPI0001E564C8|nr:hypothetical protein [Roseibium sp. TrichSKD4]EFO33403.1 conserved hypothetical protein [Roseibium sp. TrichSKD4]
MTPAAEIEKQVSAAGFLVVGSFLPEDKIELPRLSDPSASLALVLIGSAGPAFWQAFQKSPEFSDANPDPMDRFTRRVLTQIAADLGLEVLFPFDGPPYYPFQRWAKACGGFSQSPLGVLAHETYGPWLGLRGAFVVPSARESTPEMAVDGPCVTCADKPCLSVCPVGAISLDCGYDYLACRSYLKDNPSAECWQGCLARHACPFGKDHAHLPEQARFHMTSFVSV